MNHVESFIYTVPPVCIKLMKLNQNCDKNIVLSAPAVFIVFSFILSFDLKTNRQKNFTEVSIFKVNSKQTN